MHTVTKSHKLRFPTRRHQELPAGQPSSCRQCYRANGEFREDLNTDPAVRRALPPAEGGILSMVCLNAG